MKKKDDSFVLSHSSEDVGLRKYATRGAAIVLMAQITNFIIGTAGSVLLARLLSPADFGVVSMVLVVSLLLQNFGVNGFIESVVQAKDLQHDDLSALFWINVILNTCLCLCFLAFVPGIAWFYHEPVVKPIALAISSTIFISGLSNQHRGLMIRRMEFGKVSTCTIAATIGSTFLAVTLAIEGWGYWSLVAKWVVSPIILLLTTWALCEWRPSFSLEWGRIKPMVSFALNTYGHFLVNYWHRNIGKVAVGRFWNSEILGYYDRSYYLSSLLPDQLVHPLADVALSTLSKMSHTPKRFRENYLKILSTLSFICMPLSSIVALTGKDIILLVFGPKWTRAGEIFTLFALSIGIYTVYITHVWLHLSLGTPKNLFRWSILALGLTIFLFLLAYPFGVEGIAGAYSLSFLFLLFPGLWFAGRPVDLKCQEILSAIWKSSVASSLSTLITWFLLFSLEASSYRFLIFSPILRILGSSILCLSLYLFIDLALLNDKDSLKEVLKIVQEIFRKK